MTPYVYVYIVGTPHPADRLQNTAPGLLCVLHYAVPFCVCVCVLFETAIRTMRANGVDGYTKHVPIPVGRQINKQTRIVYAAVDKGVRGFRFGCRGQSIGMGFRLRAIKKTHPDQIGDIGEAHLRFVPPRYTDFNPGGKP